MRDWLIKVGCGLLWSCCALSALPACAQPKAEIPTYKLPDYAKPDKYMERSVEFGTAPWIVKGKLLRPNDRSIVPAVILVHGSGPQDEDETIGPNKPFRDLAVGLASNGIAVLRYPKRTYAHRLRLAVQKTITVREEVIDDALDAVRFLQEQSDIDHDKIFVLGHSLGATMAPQIAVESQSLAGVILLAGSARDFYEILQDQLDYIASLPTPDQSKNRELKDTIAKAITQARAGGNTDSILILGASATYWNEINDYGKRSLQIAQGLKCRMLIAGGGRDYQITRKDFDFYETTLKKHKNASFRWYKDLNHLFAPGKEKATPQEYAKANHVDQMVIDDLTKWIKGL